MREEPYQGQWVFTCRSEPYDWQSVYAVVVSGDRWNPCGHALLRVGQNLFHIAGVRRRPYWLALSRYGRYLAENGKRELRKDVVHVPDPHAAQRKLEELTARTWYWGVLAHNCASFVEEVIQAGGARSAGIYTNCPRVERFQ